MHEEKNSKKKNNKKEKKKSKYNSTIGGRIQQVILLLVGISVSVVAISGSVLNYMSTSSTVKQLMEETVKITSDRIAKEVLSVQNIVTELGTEDSMANDTISPEDKQDRKSVV